MEMAGGRLATGARSPAVDEGGGMMARGRNVGGAVVERLPRVPAHLLGLAERAEVAHGLLTTRACDMPSRWLATTMKTLATTASNDSRLVEKTPWIRAHT
jgi:hypothetical protein